jgi:hypothetical protein
VKSIGDHQLHPIVLGSADHRQAVLFGDCHRLLAENVDPGLSGPLGVLAMQVIRKCDVHRVYDAAAQALIELVVGVPALHLVAAAQSFELLRII